MPEDKSNVVAQIPEGVAKVNSFLEGLPGANQIMHNLGKEAIDSKVITFVDKVPAVEKVVENNTQVVENSPAVKEEKNTPDPKAAEKAAAGEVEKPIVEVNVEIEDELSEEDKKNPLIKVAKTKVGKSAFDFANIDQVKEAAKKTLGIEIKDDKDFGKVFSSALTWRADAQKLPEVQAELTEITELLEATPAPLIEALKAYHKGDADWANSIVNMPKFDFKKPVDKQDIKILVSSYFPNEFTDEDWNEATEPKALTIAKQSAKEKFSADKRELEQQSAAQLKDANLRRDARVESISNSLTVLKQSFPDLDKSDVKDIQKLLEGGDINSLFFNKNGAYKPDAAKRIMMALYGESAISNMTKVAAKRAESKTNETILTRGADTPKPEKNAGGTKEVVSEQTLKKVEEFTKGVNKKTTY